MNLLTLKKEWLQEENTYFEGWDFSHLKGRWLDEQLPWEYREIIQKYLKKSDSLLDMGTGGGEFLWSLQPFFPLCSVSEGYEPNVLKCERELLPLGVRVRRIKEEMSIPYEDEEFDIVINRHSPYDLEEVKRVLKHNGLFITQQIGEQNDIDLIHKLGLVRENISDKCKNLTTALDWAKAVGFKIEAGYEAFTPIQFYDVGAFVYFAHIIEWEFVDFSVETHFETLCEFQKEVEKHGFMEGKEHRYLMVLRKV